MIFINAISPHFHFWDIAELLTKTEIPAEKRGSGTV
jgi:hypothetical protein